MKRLYCIRGAACAQNTAESIKEATLEMCSKIIEENKLNAVDIVSMHFTLTKDLDKMNPCAAFRKNYTKIDTSNIPFFCSQEAYIQGGLEKVIRVIVTVYMEENSIPCGIYIRGAEKLRPDLKKN